jgi:hypothetical protein
LRLGLRVHRNFRNPRGKRSSPSPCRRHAGRAAVPASAAAAPGGRAWRPLPSSRALSRSSPSDTERLETLASLSSRASFETRDRRGRFHDSDQLKPRLAKQGLQLLLASLTSTAKHRHHLHVCQVIGRDAARRGIEANPGFSVPHAYLAAALVRLCRMEEARKAAQDMLERDPGFRIQGFRQTVGINRLVFDPFAAAWREAGLPE